MRQFLTMAGLSVLIWAPIHAQTSKKGDGTFVATAYSRRGISATGGTPDRGEAAADPRVLPPGTVVQVAGAGAYSGTYVVTDTGGRIKGHRIDIFVPNLAKAKNFGRKTVRVHVVQWGK